jgi:hypothetical protein
MRWAKFTVLVLGLVVASGPMYGTAGEPGKGQETANKLVGTWKLVSAKYGGKESKFPEGTTMLKHVTPTQFIWVTYDKEGKVFRMAGGPCTLKGDQYEETPEYGLSSDFNFIKGKTHRFTARVEGNRWYSDGALSGRLTINEMWQRVEKK